MRYEFDVELGQVWHRPPVKKVYPRREFPPIRRILVLAYQIRDHMTENGIHSLSELSRRMDVTPARASQILSFLQLSARIQEQILLGDYSRLYGLSEYIIRPIFKEILWERQEELWKKCRIMKGKRRHQLLL